VTVGFSNLTLQAAVGQLVEIVADECLSNCTGLAKSTQDTRHDLM